MADGCGFTPLILKRLQICMKNVQLWLANNEKVRYIDSSVFYNMYIVTISTLGGGGCFFFFFWQIRQNWDSKYWACFSSMTCSLLNKLHISPLRTEAIHFPIVSWVSLHVVFWMKSWTLRATLGLLRMLYPYVSQSDPSFFYQAQNWYPNSQLLPCNHSAPTQRTHHRGRAYLFNLLVPNTPSRSSGPSSEPIGMTVNLRPACPSPLIAHKTTPWSQVPGLVTKWSLQS